MRGEKTTSAKLESLHVPYVIDAANDGVMIDRARFLDDHSEVELFPGAVAHWAKAAHEKWFVSMRRRGIRD